jgi:hypothetical protein
VFTVVTERQRKFTYLFSPRITGIETKMMLIIFVGLIAKLTSVSGFFFFGNQDERNLNWNKVGVSVFIQFLKQAAF